MYLVNDGPGSSCGRMPVPLHVCPTCSHGIKPARGWTWLQSKPILDAAPECRFIQISLGASVDVDGNLLPSTRYPGPECETCPMGGTKDMRVGLMWVGGKFYAKTEDFTKEASRMGISKRISQIPKELEVGKTWVWLAHRECLEPVHGADCEIALAEADGTTCTCGGWKDMVHTEGCGTCSCPMTPGIFHAFIPTRVEYVVKGTETEAELDALEKRGLTLVKVEHLGENGELLLGDPNKPEPKDDDGE